MALDSLFLLAADTGAGETDIFKQFGVHWAPFIAQLVNFFIICLVLKKFAFGPVQEMLEKRRMRIQDAEDKLKQLNSGVLDGAVVVSCKDSRSAPFTHRRAALRRPQFRC
mgnify:CR=1 FL=1